MRIKLRKGLDIVLDGAPQQAPRQGRSVATVAVLGRDYPEIRPGFRVSEGERVRTGQVLFVDRKRPGIRFTAPATGIVETVGTGHRRTLDTLVIRLGEEEHETFEPASGGDRRFPRDLLLASGAWTSFRTRPFGRLPDPEAVPAAIFVTAMETDPLAADARIVLAPHMEWFHRGLAAMKHLADGPIFLCQAPGPDLAAGDERLRVVTFAGRHPAGLPGTHIHHLMPASARRAVWHIGYQDVVAIGSLLETGRLWTGRTVALGGPAVRRPGLVTTRTGACLDDLLEDETTDGVPRILSGSILSGRASAYLGRYHTQVSVLPPNGDPRSPSRIRAWLDRLPRAVAGPTIPIETLDAAMPLDILPVPLMRALGIGDVETAERLGCLELVEEDVALLSWLCPGGADYGALLRRVLDELEGGHA